MNLFQVHHLLLVSVVIMIVIISVMFTAYVFNKVNAERQQRYFNVLQKQHTEIVAEYLKLAKELNEIKMFLGGTEQRMGEMVSYLRAANS